MSVIISIHAPVKGATSSTNGDRRLVHNFNPRTREGCDVKATESNAEINDFNPRTREGCDHQARLHPFNDVVISIHAPVKGATRLYAGDQ